MLNPEQFESHQAASPSEEDYPTPREAIAAANYLGEEIVTDMVGPGGLSGATREQLRELVNYARSHG